MARITVSSRPKQQRPRRGGAQAAEGEENDGDDVLEDQDAYGDPAVISLQLVADLQGLRGQDGAGEAERDGDDQGGGEVEAERYADRREERRAQGHLHEAHAEHFRPQHAAEPQVQPDREQEQEHPEVAYLVQQLARRGPTPKSASTAPMYPTSGGTFR